ncbi:hypothetical protein [Nocardioides sp. YIM 152588]|uniref:hypothetical protein n=1 Tax=Nocardioides sp. YIM 152588 TaxID=3158259 RepID=UPI0032E3F110
MRRPARSLAALASAALALALAGCSTDQPTDDDGRLVLSPPRDGAGHTHAPGEGDVQPIGDGTSDSAGGYRMVDVALPGSADGPGDVTFRILGPDGEPVTEYLEEQTRLLHLYVVRDDLAVFRHLHPTLETDGRDAGTWTARVDLGEPGDYRVLAEFQPAGAGAAVALGADATVPGDWSPAPVAASDDGDDGDGGADDGVVRVVPEAAGEVGPDGRISLLVSDLDGRPLTLGSYLGTFAHLTGFALDDDGFVHVHPYGQPEQTADGTRLVFHTAFDAAGDFRFFVQVRVDGFLRTVPVTIAVTD